MKKTILILTLAIITIAGCYAQQISTIYTKGGKPIEVLILNEFSPHDIQIINQEFCRRFPQAVFIANASGRYNCHSYAWNISDGGETVCWINQFDSNSKPNIAKYWTNDYYWETSESNAKKVFYYNSDHSAIVSSTVPGMYESKWGQAPLMRHAPGYGPYQNMNQRKYFYEYINPVSGLLTCSVGSGPISVNTSADYVAEMSFSDNVYKKCVIETANEKDAFELGYAIINSTFPNGVNVTFTHPGVYQMYLRFYNSSNQLIAEYWYEPVVEPF